MHSCVPESCLHSRLLLLLVQRWASSGFHGGARQHASQKSTLRALDLHGTGEEGAGHHQLGLRGMAFELFIFNAAIAEHLWPHKLCYMGPRLSCWYEDPWEDSTEVYTEFMDRTLWSREQKGDSTEFQLIRPQSRQVEPTRCRMASSASQEMMKPETSSASGICCILQNTVSSP